MNRVECLLDCGCWTRIRIDSAKMNAVAACVVHGNNAVIIQANYYEWHVRCQSLFCSYGRWTGQSKELAEYRRDRHAQAKDHRCGRTYDRITWDGKGSVYREDRDRPKKVPEPAVPLTFSWESTPPF